MEDGRRIPLLAGPQQRGQASSLPVCLPIARVIPSSAGSVHPRYNGLSTLQLSAMSETRDLLPPDLRRKKAPKRVSIYTFVLFAVMFGWQAPCKPYNEAVEISQPFLILVSENMNNGCHRIIAVVSFCFISILLVGCQGQSPVDLSGAAGAHATATPTDVPNKEGQVAINVPPTTAPVALPTPSGKIAFVSNRDGNQKVYVVGADGANQLLLGDDTIQATSPRWSADGKLLAFVAETNKNTNIYLVDTDGTNLRQLTDSRAKDDAPAWSPNGQQLVFESYRDQNWEIYSISVDGSGLTRLTNDTAGDTNPAWSPDGQWIVFVSNRSGNASLYVMHPDGSALARMTQGIAPTSDPVWSPDGKSIAFRRWPYSGLSDICVITIAGFQENCFTSNLQTGVPAWSPDGRYLAFRSNINKVWKISVLDVGAARVSYISSDVAPSGDPVWAPDSLYIAFQARYNNNMELFYTNVVTKTVNLLTKDVAASYNGDPSWAQ